MTFPRRRHEHFGIGHRESRMPPPPDNSRLAFIASLVLTRSFFVTEYQGLGYIGVDYGTQTEIFARGPETPSLW